MSISFLQESKDLFAANFRVVYQGNCIGRLQMQGHAGSREGVWSGNVMGRNVLLRPIRSIGDFAYEIFVNDAAVGIVRQVDVKAGLFSRYQYHEMQLNHQVYELYSVGLGKAGGAACLYQGQNQVAEIDSEATVRNDLHNFEIFAVDQNNAFVSVLMCCFMYVRGCYRPGEKVTSSEATYISITTNKALKAKYNPQFKNTHDTI